MGPTGWARPRCLTTSGTDSRRQGCLLLCSMSIGSTVHGRWLRMIRETSGLRRTTCAPCGTTISAVVDGRRSFAGVIETDQDQRRYEECFGVELLVVHLTASPEVAAERLRGRYPSSRKEALTWHLECHQALAERLQASPHAFVIDTDDVTPEHVASVVLEQFRSRIHAWRRAE